MPRLRASVALCTFNGERFLEQQVLSLFAQERAPDEIVAVDDASGDGTFSMLKSLAARSPVPMHVYRNDATLGHVANFERAIALTRGEIIFLCDQDDVWDPEKIATCLIPMESDAGAQLVHSDADLVDSDLRPLALTQFAALGLSRHERELEDAGHAFEVLLRRNIVTGATAAIRRSVFEQAAPFPREWIHDEWLAIVASLIGRMVRIDRPLIRYRQHGANVIGAAPRGVAQKIDMLLAGRRDYQRHLLRRLTVLEERMRNLSPGPGSGALLRVRQTRAHAAVRAGMHPARWRRLPAVIHEIATLGYFRYARGWNSVARDLLGPIDPC